MRCPGDNETIIRSLKHDEQILCSLRHDELWFSIRLCVLGIKGLVIYIKPM